MDWKEYEKQYFNFLEAIHRSAVISSIGSKIFEDFPKNLPSTVQSKFVHIMDKFIMQIQERISQARSKQISEPSSGGKDAKFKFLEFDPEFSAILFCFLQVRFFKGEDFEVFDSDMKNALCE